MGLYDHAMVTSPTGKGVIVMGGRRSSGVNSKAMFELTQSMNWTRLEQTLQMECLLQFQFKMSWSQNKIEMTYSIFIYFLYTFLMLDFTKFV